MYRLEPLTDEIVEATQENWRSFLDTVEDEFSTWGYLSVLDSASRFAEGGDRDAYQYALLPMNSEVAEALTVVTHKFPGHVQDPECAIKVLGIRTHPHYDTRVPVAGDDTITRRRTRTVRVLSSLLTELIALSYGDLEANKVKVLVNKQVDSDFFSRLEEHLAADGEDEAYEFRAYANWFEIAKKVG